MNELSSHEMAGATAHQPDLPLDAPPLPPGTPHLPARMVNEYTYCPRLAYLEWVQGEWAESADILHRERDHLLMLDIGPAENVQPRVLSFGKTFAPVECAPVIV